MNERYEREQARRAFIKAQNRLKNEYNKYPQDVAKIARLKAERNTLKSILNGSAFGNDQSR